MAPYQSILDSPLKARDFTAMEFHPLGTARMGATDRTSIVDFEPARARHVNPQVTIMAFALRAADAIAADLSA